MTAERAPQKSVRAFYLATITHGLHPKPKQRELLERFSTLALSKVDQRGDPKNYPPHRRDLNETFFYYHPDLVDRGQTEPLGLHQMGGKIKSWLEANKLYSPATEDWFRANLVWEHIMGGGNPTDISQEWKKYLRVEINGRTFDFPDPNSIRPWKHYEEEEKILAYRGATNYWFVRAMTSIVDAEKLLPVLWAYLMIYQLNSDRQHPKNHGEPIYSRVVNTISARDPDWSALQESLWLGRIAGAPTPRSLFVHLATTILCSLTKTAEWETNNSR